MGAEGRSPRTLVGAALLETAGDAGADPPEIPNSRRPRHFRSLMSPLPRAIFVATLLNPVGKVIRVRLRTGQRMHLRKHVPTDRWVAREIFGLEAYRPLRELAPVRRIVDVGANIGCSIIYFAGLFPDARFEAFEPHPDNLDLLAYHFAINRLTARVHLHPFAAGTGEAYAYLTDRGGSSEVVASPEMDTIPIRIVDFFTAMAPGRIDLLKMDCEGGEWEIVMDPRFETLDIGAIVMEWHVSRRRPNGKHELTARLESLGWTLYELDEGHDYGEDTHGSLWAMR